MPHLFFPPQHGQYDLVSGLVSFKYFKQLINIFDRPIINRDDDIANHDVTERISEERFQAGNSRRPARDDIEHGHATFYSKRGEELRRSILYAEHRTFELAVPRGVTARGDAATAAYAMDMPDSAAGHQGGTGAPIIKPVSPAKNNCLSDITLRDLRSAPMRYPENLCDV